jgi:hypothetical protein
MTKPTLTLAELDAAILAESVAILHVQFERFRNGSTLMCLDGQLARRVLATHCRLAAWDLVPNMYLYGEVSRVDYRPVLRHVPVFEDDPLPWNPYG